MTDSTRHLSAVPDPDEDLIGPIPPAPPPVKIYSTLEEAVKDGSYLDVLKTQQRSVARLLDGPVTAQTAQLHRSLSALSKEVREYEDLIGTANRPRTPDEPFVRDA